MTLLDVEKLSVDIGGEAILKDVSLALSPGQVLGLVGESGSGKSMTALAIAGLLPQGARARGSIRLAGENLLALPEAAMCDKRGAAIGMVFQEPMTALNPLQTIGDQVAETIRIHRSVSVHEARDQTGQVLERVGLAPGKFAPSRYPHELSGGQRQRVVIAIAIALKPGLLIADEPTTALDVTTQARVLDLLRSLTTEDGTGLILITHDLAVVADMADQIAIMKDGEIVETDETLSLFSQMKSPYTRALYAATDHTPQRAGADPGTETGEARPILEADNLVRDYRLPRQSLLRGGGVFRAVNGVGLEIKRGENVGLVGESGCGKSTLARMILGLEATDGGRILLDGADFGEARGAERARLRRHIQVVFQDPYGSFNPRRRVDWLVAEPFHLLDRPISTQEQRQRVVDMLTNVGLKADDGRKYPHEFSGGQRQRIAIARALITNPSLIVLDEAVSALDVSVRARVLDLLADLSDRLKVSYLFISHDLGVVRTITDRVLIMRAGEIVEAGETEAVFTDPQHDYTRSLIAATPDLERALAARRRRGAESEKGHDDDR